MFITVNILTNLCQWIFQNVHLWLKCTNGDVCATVPLSIMSVPLQLTHQSRYLKLFTSCTLSSRLVVPDFVVNCIRSRMFSGPKSGIWWGWLQSLRLMHFQSGCSEWCRDVKGDNSCRKADDQQNLLKIIMWDYNIHNKLTYTTNSLNMSEVTNNPVYKLTTDSLPLVIMNVLFKDQFLNTEISQGSVKTRLRCGREINDQFVMQSLLSLILKKLWQSISNCRSYGQEYSVLFFFWLAECRQIGRVVSGRAPIRKSLKL